ncbi:hypothetical protein RRG08_034905 [Elysia crispata]|uniref:Uncharacterized protein n=1 Tax=Elysia crispata TaxID=231223 RepID=A0AAE1D374_9GAST|nr:hypothetical protein RRG08_034905 [Elysia crispata]
MSSVSMLVGYHVQCVGVGRLSCPVCRCWSVIMSSVSVLVGYHVQCVGVGLIKRLEDDAQVTPCNRAEDKTFKSEEFSSSSRVVGVDDLPCQRYLVA